jgi:lysine 2,3-aminomutase
MRKEEFREHISPFIQSKLDQMDPDSKEYISIANQYIYSSKEDENATASNQKHYEANLGLPNVERLYKNHGCVEINFSCGAHCRYCLRSNYDGHVISDGLIDQVVDYWRVNELNEILITGGDPFLSPKKLGLLIDKLLDNVPSLRIIRIATRTFTQRPDLVNSEILRILKATSQRCTVEVATQINSPVELTWQESIDAIKSVTDLGIKVYAQNVFLKGVNDTPEQLIELYFLMRKYNIEAHYLFHTCPIKSTDHLRPSVKTMIRCYEELVNSGKITGRSKPLLAIMSSIGKITLTPFNVLEYVEGVYIKLRSNYKYDDRIAYNPEWKLPEEAWVNKGGYLCIKYLDGNA